MPEATDPQTSAAANAMRTRPAASVQRAAPTDVPTLAVTPSTKKLKTLVPSCVVEATRQNEACIPVSRRPRRAIWTASARGTTAFITAAESETRRRVSVETWFDGDIATGRAPAPERARRYEPTEENPFVARAPSQRGRGRFFDDDLGASAVFPRPRG